MEICSGAWSEYMFREMIRKENRAFFWDAGAGGQGRFVVFLFVAIQKWLSC